MTIQANNYFVSGFFVHQVPLPEQTISTPSMQPLQEHLQRAFQNGGGSGLVGTQIACAAYLPPPAPLAQTGTPTATYSTTNPESRGGLIQTSKTPPEYVTPGGYKIATEGKDQAWTITTPEGSKTRIWGDPHVHESDGGKWDFKKDMSFVLPDGTKITAKTVASGGNTTVTGSIDIMNGNQRATISNIDKATTPSELADSGIQHDRWAVDARISDGDYAVLGGSGADWFLHGKNEIVGSQNNGEQLITRSGGPRGVSSQAQDAMREYPRFGSSMFMNQMYQQILQQMNAIMGWNFSHPTF